MDWDKMAKAKEAELISDLKGIIAIPSLLDEDDAKAGAPFGTKVREALDYMLDLGRRDGFKVTDVDGYAGIIEYGEGEEIVGILGHLDVVPPGDGWHYDPWKVVEREGYLFGRGTMDDKGPTLAAYTALRILKEHGFKPSKKIYLIVGCDEESGMRCMRYYRDHAPIPSIGFTPDSDFPVIYGEKGGLGLLLSGEKPSVIEELNAGERPNVVIGQASVLVDAPLKKQLFDFYLSANRLSGSSEAKGDKSCYSITGRSAHASTPYLGVNAAWHLLNFVGSAYDDEVAKGYAAALNDWRGSGLDIDVNGMHMGFLTMNLGIIRFAKNKQEAILDIRFPNDVTGEELVKRAQAAVKKAGWPFVVEAKRIGKPLFVDPSGPLVSTLIEIYRKHTGDTFSPPLTMGGGTYAKVFDNFVAFGPEFTNRPVPEFVGVIHGPDEAARIQDLLDACAIYGEAIEQLSK